MGGRNSVAVYSTTNQLVNGRAQDARKSCTQLRTDKGFVDSIKSNHFEYGDVERHYKPNYHYQTMQGTTHNNKGNPMAIKPTLDRAQL